MHDVALFIVVMGLQASAPLAEDAASKPPMAAEPMSESPPVRDLRRFTVGANIGFNSLAGAGLWLSANIDPHWALDAGFGYGYTGFRTSLQARYNFFNTGRWTPFAALGALYNWQTYGSGGSGGLYSLPGGASYPALFLAPKVGISCQAYNGFSFMAGFGYAVQVAGRRPQALSRLDLAFIGNAPVVDMGIGYAF